jgi:hypothetical protein
MTRQELINKASAEIGTSEIPANSNNVKYNTWLYGKQVSGPNYPWCAAFVSWLFKGTDLCPKTASCLSMLEWFEAHNRIVKDPQVGDLVFFKYSTNNRRTNHVGVVESVSGKTINTIEGNTSVTSNDNGGKVMRRKRNKNIVGYARPNYTEDKKTIAQVAQEVIDGKWGNGAERKKKLQSFGYDPNEVQKVVNSMLKNTL